MKTLFQIQKPPTLPPTSSTQQISRLRTVLAAALSLLPLGQPLVLGSSTALATGAVLLSTQAEVAQSKQFFIKRGYTKFKKGDYQESITDFDKALEIDPQLVAAYYNRGNAKRKSGGNQGAITDYTKAIEINPQLAAAYRNRGIAKELVGDLKGACADWKEASSLGDKDAAGWVRKQCQ